MPVSGVVITCSPDRVQGLAESLAQPGTVEIHGTLPEGKLVAVIESDSVAGEVEVVQRLMSTDGVVDVQLVYHNFEDLAQ